MKDFYISMVGLIVIVAAALALSLLSCAPLQNDRRAACAAECFAQVAIESAVCVDKSAESIIELQACIARCMCATTPPAPTEPAPQSEQ